MKVKTSTQLSDLLDEEIGWRRKEITSLLFTLKNEKRTHILKIMTRSGIALGYAHWEGFIKNSTSYYLNYINNQGIKGKDISHEMRSSYLWAKFRQNAQAQSVISFREILKHIENDLDNEDIHFSESKLVQTKSNLRFDRFKEITLRAGIDHKPFELKQKMIDNFVNHRNEVAHGNYLYISVDEVIDFLETVRLMLSDYKTEIENKIALGAV